MENFGININYVLLQLLNFAIIVGWPVVSIFGIFSLRKRQLSSTPQALWALVILAIPFLGAIAFWILQPEDKDISSLM